MKTNIVAAVLAVTSGAMSYAVRSANRISDLDLADAPPMVFTGQIMIGGPNVTLTGKAESIHEQILNASPAYNPWDFQDYREHMETAGIIREMAKRGEVTSPSPLSRRGGITCNPDGDKIGQWVMQCDEGDGAVALAAAALTAAASSSANDNFYEISVWCGNLVVDFFDIARECQDDFGRLKGEVFRDGPPAWNTIAKGQSC